MHRKVLNSKDIDAFLLDVLIIMKATKSHRITMNTIPTNLMFHRNTDGKLTILL
jgi:hypothetical protein